MKIVVIGGSGLIGSKLVAGLRVLGHDAVSAALDTGLNTITGEGLAEAVDGAAVVVDVSNSPTYEDGAVLDFFETSTRNVLAAERTAGVGHHVLLSIVGTDRLPDSAYYRAKLAQEQLVATSGAPYSIVRSTQFFEFMERIGDAATSDGVVRVAPVFVQPIAADEVASALARVSVGAPLNGIVEVAGPEQFLLDELIRRVQSNRSVPLDVVADSQAPYFGGLLEPGTLVPAVDAQLGSIRFEDWVRQDSSSRMPTA